MPFSLAREELARFWRELRGPATTPGRTAVAVALGFAAGMPPQAGLRIALLPLVCATCVVYKLDAAIAVASTVAAVLARRLVPLPMLASIAWGAAVSLLVLALLAALPRPSPRPPYELPIDAPPWVTAVERVAARYASPVSPRAVERALFHWVRTKLLGDPVAKLAADLASGSLLDVGTGRGQVALLLLLLGRVSRVRGIDWDARKIAAASRAAEGLDASFVQGDARTAQLEPCDTVLLIDVLHYFTIAEQDAILDRAAAAVRPGGRILVREADAAAGWRSVATFCEERLFTSLRVNRGERLRFRAAFDLVRRLEAAGLSCEVRPAWAGTPFSNVLVIGRRPPVDASARAADPLRSSRPSAKTQE